MSACETGRIIEVVAGPHDRQNVIVTAMCDDDCGCGGNHALYELDAEGKRGAQVVCQCVAECGCEDDDCDSECGELVWIVPELKAGETKRYEVCAGTDEQCGCGCATESFEAVTIGIVGDEHAEVHINGQHFTSYVFKEGIARPYCYPVFGPGGAEMTNFAPGDHIHHKSLYIAQGAINGYDNWSEMPGHASTVTQHIVVISEGPIFAELAILNDWVSPKGELLLQELVRIRFYNLPDTERFMDWNITWYAAYCGVHFGDTKEAGTISIRVAESMEVPNGGTIRNSWGGINDDECWGKRAEWVDYYGPISSGTGGIAIFDHPQNHGYPTHWHVRGYGLFTANQWGIHDFTGDHSKRGDLTLEQGDALNFMFRIYLHEGDTDSANVAGKYLDYIFPPKVI